MIEQAKLPLSFAIRETDPGRAIELLHEVMGGGFEDPSQRHLYQREVEPLLAALAAAAQDPAILDAVHQVAQAYRLTEEQ